MLPPPAAGRLSVAAGLCEPTMIAEVGATLPPPAAFRMRTPWPWNQVKLPAAAVPQFAVVGPPVTGLMTSRTARVPVEARPSWAQSPAPFAYGLKKGIAVQLLPI